MAQQKTIKCPDNDQTVVENEPRVSINVKRTIMVAGKMAEPGDRVTNLPMHQAFGLKDRGCAELVDAGDA